MRGKPALVRRVAYTWRYGAVVNPPGSYLEFVRPREAQSRKRMKKRKEEEGGGIENGERENIITREGKHPGPAAIGVW